MPHRTRSSLTGETIEYSYDRRGLCTGVKSPIHHAVYEYGRAGELLAAKDLTTGVEVRFKYDSLMREVERAFEGGARQLTSYDRAGRATSVRTLDRNGEVKAEWLHYGDDGRILASMDERGRVTLYGYDGQGRVSKVLYPFTNDILSKARAEYEAAGGNGNATADGKEITVGEPIKKAFKLLSGRDCQERQKSWEERYAYDADGNRSSKATALGTIYYKYDSEDRLISYGVTEAADAARLEYDADGNLLREATCTKEAVYAYKYINRMAESHITEIRGGSRQTPRDTVYAYDGFGRRILEADILNRWARHTEYRGLSMDVWKNAAVHGTKEPRESRGIDSAGMKFTELGDFLPAFGDLCRASPYDFTHVALTLPLSFGGEVLGRMQTEHSGINFNPFVTVGHTDAERHYLGKDHLGSIRAVLNKWGSPLRTYDYDVFGNPLQDRPERHRLGFTGKEFDSWTGLYDYGFRDYSPVHGRFTTSDPIQDGYNWYAYVNSDPVNWLDPWGLECPPNAQSGEDVKSDPLYQYDERLYPIYSNNVTGRYIGEPLTPKELVIGKPVIVNILVVLKPKEINQNGAVKGEVSVFYDNPASPFGMYGVLMGSFPAVSGSSQDSPAPEGVHNDLTPERTSTSSNKILKDSNHGGSDNIMIRLPNTGGDAIHQANSQTTIDSSYTEGCIAITGSEKGEVEINYKQFKSLIQAKKNIGGTVNVTILYGSNE